MNCIKIILFDYFCDLDEYRNDQGELTISVPKSANIALVKKIEEQIDLAEIKSDFSVSFDLPISNREREIFGRLERLETNDGRLIYRAIMEVDGLPLIDGQLYIDATSERVRDSKLSYKVQMIGTHQTWKEAFKGMKLTDLDLGEIEWTEANILDLAQNNGTYSSGGDTIYPLLADFGEMFGENNDTNVYDIRFLVHKKAILEKAFCRAGYKVKGNIQNQTGFLRKGDYCLQNDFGLNENIDSGTFAEASLSVDYTMASGGTLFSVFPFDTDVSDRTNKFDTANWWYINNIGKRIYNPSVSVNIDICNPDPINPSSSNIIVLIVDSGLNAVLPGLGWYVIPESIRDATSTNLAPLECYNTTATVDLGQVLKDNSVNDGFLEPTWRIWIGSTQSSDGNVVQAGSSVSFNARSFNHFNQFDIIPIASVLDPNLSLYDWLLDNKTLYNLRFQTDQAAGEVVIEPRPSKYSTYNLIDENSYLARGFEGDPFRAKDLLDLTSKIDICQDIEKDIPNIQRKEYFFFKFKESTDEYDKYEEFTDEDPLFSYDTSVGQFNPTVKDVQLKVYEPTLNFYSVDINAVIGSSGLINPPGYVPFMWANAQDEGSSVKPEPGTDLGIRTFHIFGCQKQVFQVGSTYYPIPWDFEGTEQDFIPCVGQVFEALIEISPGVYAVPEENILFRDNLTENPTGKNFVNTYYPEALTDQRNVVEFDLKLNLSNLDFYCFDSRKLIVINSTDSKLARFNGIYRWAAIKKQITKKDLTIITLKPIIPCDNG